MERSFRQALIKRDIGDDDIFPRRFGVNAVFDVEPRNVWGVDVARTKPAEEGGAWAYDPPLKTEADFDRLRFPVIRYNAEATQRAMDRAHEVLGDILPVERVCPPPVPGACHPTLGHVAADLLGLEQMMMDLVMAPELAHRLMAHVRDGALRALDQLEASGVMTPNANGPMYCFDPIGPAGPVTAKNCVCAANSQEFDQVSPAMWEEFCLQYQKPIFARYGLAAYGCCENLTHKISGVLSIPNLRIFVCSAWTNLDTVLEKVGPQYVIMWRQKASDVVFPHSVRELKRQLDEGVDKLKGRRFQIVLRELQTLAGHPDRLHVWTRLAKEAAARNA
ncbi:MAG TPA: hypothetical protein P5137_01320 [Candidatus Brocadiia bacterium]|nr:hypothetical protein [Candidatus Brocadiia bacterium]